MKYLVVISYDGRYFHGFQRQKDVLTVQKVMEEKLSEILKENIVIKGSGRTDASVHAYGQCFHFVSNQTIFNLKGKLNKKLEHIKVKKIKKVAADFHARHSAIKKHYIYKINLGKYKKEYEGYVLQLKRKIDVKKIKEIKNLFIGTYDFHNFVAGYRDNYVSTIYKINIIQKKQILEIHFYGKAFYRYMVRKLVGAMIDYSYGNVSKETIKKMLTEKDYNKELKTVKGEGLYLAKVYY